MAKIILFNLWIITSSIFFVNCTNLQLLHQWKALEFEYDSAAEEANSLKSGNYVRGAGVLIDVHLDNKGRTFVTIPKFTTGIPASLATVSDKHGPGGPLLKPYPNWEFHNSQTCGDSFISIFRVDIDKCNRMWILDSGRNGADQICPPYLYVFDINTDELVHKYEFPLSQYFPRMSLFISPAVDVRDDSCTNVRVYIADVNGFGILVYDYQENISWRIQNKLVFPFPNFGTHTIAGESFDLMDGIFGLAITPQTSPGRRYLYFHALAAVTENRVPLDLIDNSTIWLNNPESEPSQFKSIGTRGTHATIQCMDENGNLFFGINNPIGVACWDSSTNYNRDNIRVVLQNDETLQFVSSLKILKDDSGDECMFTVSCRFQRAMTGSMSTSEVNFRIQKAKINDILDGRKKCKIQDNVTSNIIYPD